MITAATCLRHSFALLALVAAALMSGCGDQRSASASTHAQADTCHEIDSQDSLVEHWQDPGMHVKILNRGAKHLDAIVTRDTFHHLFPHTVWYAEGDVVGMYNRETKMTFLVVSEHTFATWNDEISDLAERLCHEKAHRADDLYQGDQWSELRDTSAPGLELDTHHFGTEHEDESAHHSGVEVSTLAHAPVVIAMATTPASSTR